MRDHSNPAKACDRKAALEPASIAPYGDSRSRPPSEVVKGASFEQSLIPASLLDERGSRCAAPKENRTRAAGAAGSPASPTASSVVST